MNKEERKQYNHQYYVRNKTKIMASKKLKGSPPYNSSQKAIAEPHEVIIGESRKE